MNGIEIKQGQALIDHPDKQVQRLGRDLLSLGLAGFVTLFVDNVLRSSGRLQRHALFKGEVFKGEVPCLKPPASCSKV